MAAITIPELLKAAREAKRLSQRALGEKVGLPQSHISKIESGAVDLQTSSLVEIARALDLEVALLPRSALPAMHALQRQGSSEASRAADELVEEKLISLDSQAVITARRYPKIKVLDQLVRIVRELRAVRAGRLSAERILQLTATVAEIQSRLRKLERSRAESPSELLLDEIDTRLERLRQLRNSLAHGLTDQTSRPMPAYRLDEDEGDV
jgi:transcriptional regulator with XRE-family HTH domain